VDSSIPPLEPVATTAHHVRLMRVVAPLALLALGSTAIGCEMVRRPQQDDASVAVPVSPTAAPTSTATPSTTPRAVPTPSQEAASVNLTWTAAPVTASMKYAQMTAVAVGHDRYVAVGCTGLDGLGPGTTGVAWTSPDGVDWTDADVGNANNTCLDGVISSPDGYLAWGHDDNKDRAAFWHSDDGERWSRASSIKSFAHQSVGEVVHFGDRFVAFSVHDNAEIEPRARIWVSPDGVRWSDQPDAKGCDGGQTSDLNSLAAILSVLVDGTGIVTIGATSIEYHGPSAAAPHRPARRTPRSGSRGRSRVGWRRASELPEA
jgi:hypothetical protein